MSDAAAVDAPDEAGQDRAADPHSEEALAEKRRQLAREARQAAERGTGDIEIADDGPAAEARERVVREVGTPEDWDEVTNWLLGDDPEVVTRKLRVRVGGSDDEPKKMPWIIQAIPLDAIRSAEREAAGNRSARRSPQAQQYDDLKANLRVVVEGTVKPDLKDIASSRGLSDPTMLLRQKFAYRTGVIAQLAGQIMELSGFSDDDVIAAGN